MLYFIENALGQLIAVSNDYNVNSNGVTNGVKKLCRWDFLSLVAAQVMADKATVLTGKRHIATDAGEYNSPRYDVQALASVGDEVSRYFNGDAYPAGKIVKISKSLKVITTDTGIKFYRVRESGCWLNAGTWSMVSGHRNDRNPSF